LGVNVEMKKILYIDMDDVLADFLKSYHHHVKMNPAIQFPQATYGFFSELEPIPNAIESVKKLIADEQFDVYVLTAPSVRNPMCYTEKRLWIEKYFGLEFCERLIICSNKGLIKGDFLIDDYASGKGQEHFQGELLHFGPKAKYPTWADILEVLNNY